MRKLVLASTSSYRASALERLGLSFEMADPAVDETPLPGEAADSLALRLAHAKAAAVADRFDDAIVIGSDQVGICAGRLLHKPGSGAKAIEQLCSLSGKNAEFYSAVAVHDATSGRREGQTVCTRLTFRAISTAAATHYVSQDNPIDCAGSFKVESLGLALFHKVQADDPSALIGLPVIALLDQLSAYDINPLQPPLVAAR